MFSTATCGPTRLAQLLLSPEGLPEALYSGAVPGPGAAAGFTGTFTLVQPVRSKTDDTHPPPVLQCVLGPGGCSASVAIQIAAC